MSVNVKPLNITNVYEKCKNKKIYKKIPAKGLKTSF